MWIIDKDFLPDQSSAPGTNGNARGLKSRGCDEVQCVHRFRLYDDDGELYYEGRSSDADSESAFDPLDGFGAPNAGCTEIKYLRGNHWITL